MVLTGGGAYNFDDSLKHIYQNFKSGASTTYESFAAVVGVPFSSTNPDLANYNSKQDLLAIEFNNPDFSVIDLLDDDQTTEHSLTPLLYSVAMMDGPIPISDVIDSLWNPAFTALLQESIDNDTPDPCSPSNANYQVGVNDKLCETILENDLMGILYDASYNIQFCHSPDDELIAYDANLPADLLSKPNVNLSIKSGTHAEVTASCTVNDLFFLTSADFQGYMTTDVPTCVPSTSACTDSTLKFKMTSDGKKKKGKRKKCNWVSKKPELRCYVDGGMCPKTCGMCDKPCVDATALFEIKEPKGKKGKKGKGKKGKKMYQKCDWVGASDTENRCKVPGVSAACRRTCNAC